MPRYYFNVLDGSTFSDRNGVELADPGAAQRHAVMLAGQLLIEQAQVFWNGEDWRMEVTDGAGLTLFVLNIFATQASVLLRSSYTPVTFGVGCGLARGDPV